jgi:hypothetical protein
MSSPKPINDYLIIDLGSKEPMHPEHFSGEAGIIHPENLKP